MVPDTSHGGPADPARRISVLYVDDEPAQLELTTLFLGRYGDLAIDTALSARLAMGKLRAGEYDVIVADYLMPEMDGIEFLKGLRAGGCTIPFIIFTGKGREAVAIEALNSGADFYLQKGGDPKSQFAELGNMIRQAARKRRAEEALRESGQELHAILEGSPIPQFVIDRDHRIVHWNRALEEQTGIQAREVIGTSQQWRAFYTTERPCLCDLIMDGKTAELPQWYREKASPSRYMEGAYEVMDFFPDLGSHGKWLCFTAVAIRNSAGEILGALETLEDVTDRVAAEESLREQTREVEEAQAQLEALFQAFPDAYLRFDPDGNILDLRARDPLPPFRDYDRLLARRVRDLLAPAEGALVEDALREVHGTGQMRVLEFSQEIDGLRRSFEGRFLPLQEAQVIGIFRDITDRKGDEAALRQAKEKLQLLSGITRHDIGNLLTALSGYQQLALEVSSDPLLLGYLEKAQGITRQIHDLIEFTRFYQKIGMTAPVWQHLQALLDRVTREVDTGGISLVSDLQGIEVYADPLLGRAFTNIVENAVRHGRRVTRIQVGFEEIPPGLIVTFEDNGIGIRDEEKERILGNGSRGLPGSGLFLAREILAITGLTLRETGEYGRGARFEISVPAGNYRLSGPADRQVVEFPSGSPHLPAPPAER